MIDGIREPWKKKAAMELDYMYVRVRTRWCINPVYNNAAQNRLSFFSIYVLRKVLVRGLCIL